MRSEGTVMKRRSPLSHASTVACTVLLPLSASACGFIFSHGPPEGHENMTLQGRQATARRSPSSRASGAGGDRYPWPGRRAGRRHHASARYGERGRAGPTRGERAQLEWGGRVEHVFQLVILQRCDRFGQQRGSRDRARVRIGCHRCKDRQYRGDRQCRCDPPTLRPSDEVPVVTV